MNILYAAEPNLKTKNDQIKMHFLKQEKSMYIIDYSLLRQNIKKNKKTQNYLII